MKVIRSQSELGKALASLARRGGVGFVPTMGYFHEGHVALMRRAIEEGPTVVSVFVNPRQFGAGEDFERYPRAPEHDAAVAEKTGVDVLWIPPDEVIYPQGFQTVVDVPALSGLHCGRFRPGHFTGVATVVARLFGLVRPERAYFGRKDYQQTVIVKRMVQDLALPVAIRVIPTVREPDGLAMSSRNVYLSPADRAAAPGIHRALVAADRAFQQGERHVQRLVGSASAVISRIPGFRIQYLSLVDPHTLVEREGEAREGDVLLTAGFFGTTRLIDNQTLGEARV